MLLSPQKSKQIYDIGAAIRIGREIECLPYVWFLKAVSTLSSTESTFSEAGSTIAIAGSARVFGAGCTFTSVFPLLLPLFLLQALYWLHHFPFLILHQLKHIIELGVLNEPSYQQWQQNWRSISQAFLFARFITFLLVNISRTLPFLFVYLFWFSL